jgi:hypothetical protein
MAFKDDKGGVRPPAQTSKPQNTAVGGGSRPTTSKIGIETSASASPHTQGRYSGGYLK